MYIKLHITLFLLLAHTVVLSQQVNHKGMTFSWAFQGDHLQCTVSAPGRGWVAIGFNDQNSIQGSNLIMGAFEKGHFKMSDRYVVSHGNHRSVLSLKVSEAISERKVFETNQGTTMTFKIKCHPNDSLHKPLVKDQEYTIWLAYSREDDFGHHSAMRSSIKVKL